MEKRVLEVILWSIALPGFGQILNGQIVKGILFITFEFIINVQSNFNEAIMYSFLGEINKAINVVNYEWLMFYPCMYMFAIWDSCRTVINPSRFAFLPFVFGAYFVTIGLIFSAKFQLFGYLLGPIWLPMLALFPGLVIGLLLKKILDKYFLKSIQCSK